MTDCPRCGKTLRDYEVCECPTERLARKPERDCPYCKMAIPSDASICGHCRKNVSTAGMIGDGLQAIGWIATLVITVPFLLALLGLKAC